MLLTSIAVFITLKKLTTKHIYEDIVENASRGTYSSGIVSEKEEDEEEKNAYSYTEYTILKRTGLLIQLKKDTLFFKLYLNIVKCF